VEVVVAMRLRARAGFAGLVAAAALALVGLAASSAYGWGAAKWEAGTCEGTEITVKKCEYVSPPSEFFTQAAGHPPWGLTSFEVTHSGSGETRVPDGTLKRIRVDVPPGLAADPQTLAACSRAEFQAHACNLLTTKAGFVELEAVVELPFPLGNKVLALKGNVFNLDQEPGLPLLFGIEVEGVEPLVEATQLYLEGHVSYATEETLKARGVPSGDFHEWFEINNIPPKVKVEELGLPLTEANLKTLKSKLFFNGHAGNGNFLTLPSECGPPEKSTSYLELESEDHKVASVATVPPVGVNGCKNVPFTPTTQVKPQDSGYDQADGAVTEVLVPQNEASSEINTADIAAGHALLPEGLTLNPSAAHGLEACAPAKVHFESTVPAECPGGSKLGTVNIETDLPKGSLSGSVYLAAPSGIPITGPPYAIYIVAESVYDVKVKVEATVAPDPSTGRLKVDVVNSPSHPFNLPQLPFAGATLTLNAGPHAPLANPLSCGSAKTESDFIAYSGEGILKEFGPSFPFTPTGCPGSTPFSLSQSTADSSNKAGAYTHYTFNLGRADGQQYLSRVSTVLPAGLVGAIPSVTLCGEPQAASGSCPAASQIGTATVYAGAGDPYPFSGPVYLTGPYAGGPYGLSIPVEAKAGPFDLGRLTTRATINVDPHSARVIATSTLPTIFKGVPLRLRNISVAVNRESFLFNPTNCGALSTNTTLTSTFNASQGLSSPFGVTGCNTLPFKPSFSAATSASTNPTTLKANGASLRVNLLQGAHEANIHSVVAELPKSLPSRLTTLQKACPEATYAANPFSCPVASKVGTATVATPVLPDKLTGPAYLVSHGGAAFPDLDLLLEGDGVRVILEGNTNIKRGITTSTFASIPDVPVSSFVLELPAGPHSALTAVGALCTQTLTMPTTVTAQSGAVLKLKTPIAVSGCRTRIKILSKRIAHNRLVLRVQTFAAGRLSVKSRYLRTTLRKFAKPGKFTIKVPLSRKGVNAQRAHKLKFKARVGFVPKSKAEAVSVAFARVGFTHKSSAKRKH
jgi:hypothetical protein